MPTPNTDRNLLFGILAIQMDFITKEDLIQAMNAWVLDKSKPIGQILLDRGALADDTHALLEALVQKHLALHDNDPDKSLAAVSSLGSVREALRQVVDPDLAASITHAASARANDDPHATRPYGAGEQTSAGLRFRILRPHDKGGLGEVFVAEDQELHREVALKEIQEQFADDPQARARFLLEAEITGGLEHPGIVPVYGLGQYADGRPFYAMRFIKGDNLKNAIERFHKAEGSNRDPGERTLEFRKLLRRFQDVCNAVGYAHSRGVLHRDLKPGNILLGQFGETLVVDWGLAKTVTSADPQATLAERPIRPLLGSGSEPTRIGSAIGTPAYMSPEQAAGRLDLMGPASDVYSLGATLYFLLTGRPAFQGSNPSEILRKVEQGAFMAPQEVKCDVPAALDAVCRKAMAMTSSARYGSPRELAEDVEHWLADEPIQSYAEPLHQRLARWTRKHQTLAASAAMVLLSAVLALGIGLVAVNEQKSKTKTALKKADDNLELAEANLTLAKKAVDDLYVLATEDPLLQQENMRKVRKLLLEKALPFYEGFKIQRSEDPSIPKELGEVFFRVGYISKEIGQRDRAKEAYDKALEFLQESQNLGAKEEEAQQNIATSLINRGNILADSRNSEAAFEDYRHAISILEELCKTNPESAKNQAELARGHLCIGVLQKDNSDLKGATESYESSHAIYKRLADKHPNYVPYQIDLAHIERALGNLNREKTGVRAALPFLSSALKKLRAIYQDHPEMIVVQTDLADTLKLVGNLTKEMGKPSEARDYLVESISILEKLHARIPEVSHYEEYLADAQMNLGLLDQEKGQTSLATKSHQSAIAHFKNLVRDNPAVGRYQNNLAKGHFNLGIVQMESRQLPQAVKSFKTAVSIHNVLAEKDPDVADYVNSLVLSYNLLAIVERESGDRPNSVLSLKEALKVQRRAVDSHPDVLSSRRELGLCHHNLGCFLLEDADLPAAEKSLRDALDIRKKLLENHLQVTDFQNEVAITLVKLADVLQEKGKPAEAAELLTEALPHHKVALSGNPKNIKYQNHFVQNRLVFGKVSLRQKDHGKAAEVARELAAMPGPAANYDAACMFALCVLIAKDDAGLAELQRNEVGSKYADAAMEQLQAAVKKGFRNAAHMKQDTDLDPIRQREDFKKMLADLEAVKK
ncbi:MAG: protein kinase domain-containing protein [Gemmataceae bacterium]